jgi:hypothetical protein
VNGKPGDSPLTDLVLYDQHPFPPDIEELLLRIHDLGRQAGRWPLGENWPFGTRDSMWERGEDLDGARRDLGLLLQKLEAGRGDEILVNPMTKRPLAEGQPE